MKQIDGVDEDVWFERVAADILESQGYGSWEERVPAHLEPLRAKIEAATDAYTADIADFIVACIIQGAVAEFDGDVARAVARLRE